MDTIRICPQCRKTVPEGAPEGLCPECLAKVALGTEPAISGRPTPPTPEQLAAQFPQLEIIELLGKGGMGMVYKARQPRLDRVVALKILPVASMPDASFGERFEREARALARLNHPGIVAIYDFGLTQDYYYFVMEYVDGMNLRQLLNAATMSPRQALELVTQICTALQYAHDEKIVHRDIKPENVLITKKGQVKIADFGLAKLIGAKTETALTASQMVMGTLNYMAPEQREKPLEVDHRADIYSLGVVFYEMLTGEIPMGRFDAPSKKVQVDVRLDEVVLHALEREPARRYQQVSEVKSNVENITATMPTVPPQLPAMPRSAAAPVSQPTSRRVLVLVLVPVLLWLACFLCILKWPGTLGPAFLPSTLLLMMYVPSIIFLWRFKIVSEGLRWRQLPPALRRRANWHVALGISVCALLFFVGTTFFPARNSQWQEEWLWPKSRAYEKIGLSGNITSYQVPFWREHSVGASGTMALKVLRKDGGPVMLTFALPGLRLENDSRDPGQYPGMAVLNLGLLTNWMRDVAGVDVSQPAVQTEAKQIITFLSQFTDVAPASWEELSAKMKKALPNFDVAELRQNFGQGGILGWLFIAFLVYPGICVCLAYYLALRRFKRAYADARAEIRAGRWTPPHLPRERFPVAIQIFLAIGIIMAAFAIVAAMDGHITEMILILAGYGAILAVLLAFHSRQEIRAARQKGLWPEMGDAPTVEHVKRLAQAGETVLAIKLYRQIYGVSLLDAKAAVEKMADLPSTAARQ